MYYHFKIYLYEPNSPTQTNCFEQIRHTLNNNFTNFSTLESLKSVSYFSYDYAVN